MANKYELGRVQGVSVWSCDFQIPATGVISREYLTPKDFDPMVGDTIIDTEGQYFQITGVADNEIYSDYVTKFGTSVNGEKLVYATYEDITNMFK